MFFQVMLHLNVLMLPVISAYEFCFFLSLARIVHGLQRYFPRSLIFFLLNFLSDTTRKSLGALSSHIRRWLFSKAITKRSF